ncbi:hypothetical protein OEZ86_007069 [Tetradesmus obliquus]|nr:hypothetical protein OEZ86_007069 [Tetradesmus obliquus]
MTELDAEKELRDNRFSYLLQPIRDLAANWDINIAGELEEYLEELEHLTFTIEGSQGTTCVFSKKVEYLHSLVYQALETIFNKKQKERQAAANKNKAARGGDASLGADGLDGPDAFLSIGSSLELALRADIDLADDEETAPPELLRAPTALLALEDAASGQGGPGSAQAGARGEVGSYRLAQCAVHVSGALLLEARDGQLFDAWLRPVRGGSGRGTAGCSGSMYPYSQAGYALDGASMLASGLGGLPVDSQCTQQQQLEPAVAAGPDDVAPDANMLGGDEYDAAVDHEGYGGDDDGFAAFDGDAPAPATAGDEEMADAQHEQQQQDEGAPDWLTQPGGQAAEGLEDGAAADTQAAADGEGAADVDGAAARVRQQRGRRGRAAAGADVGAAAGGYYDPYTPLDPAEPGSLPIKPLQVRKPKRRANIAAMQQSDAAAGASVACLNASHHPQLAWPEFGYILDRLAAAAAAARVGRRRGEQQQLASMAVGPRTAAVMDWQDAAAAEEREQQALLLEGDDADAGAGDYGGDGYEDDGADGFAAGGDLLGGASLLEAAAEAEGGGLRPWAALAGASRGDGAPDWLGGAEDGSGEPSYEELCRSHIESLIAAAAAQQVQSELAVRVSGWRSRIDPILAAEEDRSAFDIHTYGSKILERLQDTQPAAAEAEAAAEKAAEQQRQHNDAAGCEAEIVDFKQVAGASDSFEVCRLFAAMLQLVNNRNINLIQQPEPDQDGPSSSSGGGSTVSSLQLQLLTVARVHEAMAEGLAGGAAQEQDGMLHDGMLLEAPPPRARPAAKKPKTSKKAAAADAAGAEEQSPTKGGKAGKGKAAAGGKGRKGGKKGAGSSSEDEGADISNVTDSDIEEQAGQVAAAPAAGKASRARGGGRPAAGRAGKAAAAAADDSDGGAAAGSSDEEFDAEAENHGVRAAGAKGAGKGSKPPAKKPKRAARGVLA